MKYLKTYRAVITLLGALCMLFVLVEPAQAQDYFATALDADIKETLGSDGRFWKAFILVDIILATAAMVKTKSPMVFLGVAAVAFIPGILIKTFVFKV